MRIAYFTSAYPRATDTFIQREVLHLRHQGHDVLTYALRKPGMDHNVSSLVKSERDNTHYLLPANPLALIGLNIRWLFTQPGKYFNALNLALRTSRAGLKGWLFQLFYFQEALLLAQSLLINKISHLHNHFGDSSGTVSMLAGKLSDIPYSVTIHGPHIFFEPQEWALREKVKHSAFIVCISHYCKSQVMLFSDQADWHKLKIVHCGVDISEYVFAPKANPGEDKPVNMLYVGRLAGEKGVPILLQSLVELKNQGLQFHLTLYGDGADRKLLEQLVSSHGLNVYVTFAGFADQQTIRNALTNSDLFILPSFAEGVPVSLMESMAIGVPVIGTYVGGVVELITPEYSGLVVSPSDIDGLSTAIKKYINDAEFRSRVSQNARKKIEQDFNLQVELTKLETLFTGGTAHD